MNKDTTELLTTISKCYKDIYLLEWKSYELDLEYDSMCKQLDEDFYLVTSGRSCQDDYLLAELEHKRHKDALKIFAKSKRLREIALTKISQSMRQHNVDLFHKVQNHTSVRELMQSAKLIGYNLASGEKETSKNITY